MECFCLYSSELVFTLPAVLDCHVSILLFLIFNTWVIIWLHVFFFLIHTSFNIINYPHFHLVDAHTTVTCFNKTQIFIKNKNKKIKKIKHKYLFYFAIFFNRSQSLIEHRFRVEKGM